MEKGTGKNVKVTAPFVLPPFGIATTRARNWCGGVE
jgi:hypothetical protein